MPATDSCVHVYPGRFLRADAGAWRRQFFAIYAIFLFGFSHALYIASNRVNSGMTGGRRSVRARVRFATLQC